MDTSYHGDQDPLRPTRLERHFRHPMRRDARGKPGLKVRRGLNTSR